MMGLGPPICLECLEIMELLNGQPPWKCPHCGKNLNDVRSAGLLEISEEIEKLFKALEQFKNITSGK